MDIRLSNENRINIANNTSQDVYVIAAPNKDRLVVDLVFNISTTILFPTALPSTIKIVYNEYQW